MDQFAYTSGPLDLSVGGTESRGGATIEDVRYGAGGADVSAYLVLPEGTSEAPAVLYMHMLGGSVDRSQFLDEAVELATAGVASLHLQGQFPWDEDPRDLEHDRGLIVQEVVNLRRGLDVLDHRLGQRTGVTAFVGHDYGAMYGALLAAVDDRISAMVLIAGHPHFAAWFTKYWELGDAAGPAYVAGLAELDPVRYLASGRAIPLLLQFGSDDEFVSDGERAEFVEAALEPKETHIYEGDHRLTDEATVDRIRWVLSSLTTTDLPPS